MQKKDSRMPWKILAGAFILGFAIWAPVFCVPPMEHILREELLLSHTQISLLFTIPIMMVAIMAIPGGILADRIGAKKAAGILSVPEGYCTVAITPLGYPDETKEARSRKELSEFVHYDKWGAE